jgi:acetate---CoA ligase (ADP-forming) subunit beta
MSETPIEAARADGRTTLTEAESKQLLADSGVPTTSFTVVDSPASAANAAADIGFPVVIKVSSPAITHKSEWAGGIGVMVGLESKEAVREAAAEILEAASATDVDVKVLVEEAHAVDAGTEVIVGGLRNPSFGPVVLAGLGGVFTEIYEDTSHRIAPIDRTEARKALEELTAIELLRGYRGRESTDIDALVDSIVAISDLIAEHESITEIDVNPVLATANGVVALDALVVLEAE